MVIALTAAEEFAASLRIAKMLFPNHEALEGVSREELGTGNLKYEDYTVGDHWQFLYHFGWKYGVIESCPQHVVEARARYTQTVGQLPPMVRVMSIVAREMHLSRIFRRILIAEDWSGMDLRAFRYFLDRHIFFDEGDTGHGARIESLVPVNDDVLPFFLAREKLYKESLPTLFK